jgi:carboxyl-terminal processing protease
MKSLRYILVCTVLFGGCSDAFFNDEPVNNPEAVFENLYVSFVENYGPTNERDVKWDSLYSVYRPRVNPQSTSDELFTVITSMLAVLDDGHVQLTAPGKPVFNSNFIRNNKIDDELFDLDLVKSGYLEAGYQATPDNGYVYGKVKDENIAYIYFDYVAENFFVLEDFLEAYANADGLIIDLRHNQGGDFTYSYSSMGPIVDKKRLCFRSRTKTGPGPNDFTAWYDWSIEPSGAYFNKPIVVLIDRYTISAGERTAVALATLPNVTMMGDNTCGAFATMIGRELANGWYYTLPTQNTLLADGKSYEGIGVMPDVYSRNDIAAMDSGVDETLERAVDVLR